MLWKCRFAGTFTFIWRYTLRNSRAVVGNQKCFSRFSVFAFFFSPAARSFKQSKETQETAVAREGPPYFGEKEYISAQKENNHTAPPPPPPPPKKKKLKRKKTVKGCVSSCLTKVIKSCVSSCLTKFNPPGRTMNLSLSLRYVAFLTCRMQSKHE